jgi:hypothetical protein
MIVWSVNDVLEMKWEGSGPGLIDVIFFGGGEWPESSHEKH